MAANILFLFDWNLDRWQAKVLADHIAILLSAMLSVLVCLLVVILYPYMQWPRFKPRSIEVIIVPNLRN